MAKPEYKVAVPCACGRKVNVTVFLEKGKLTHKATVTGEASDDLIAAFNEGGKPEAGEGDGEGESDGE